MLMKKVRHYAECQDVESRGTVFTPCRNPSYASGHRDRSKHYNVYYALYASGSLRAFIFVGQSLSQTANSKFCHSMNASLDRVARC